MLSRDQPLPARLMAPWLDDNARFQEELALRSISKDVLISLRDRLRDQIRMVESADPCLLGAVDAASVATPFGDQLSILVQAIRIDDDGTPTLSAPERATGIDGHELRLVEMPMRIAAECRELAKATTPTIADTSYWSFLMDVNHAIIRNASSSQPMLEAAVKYLVDDGAFLGMVQNANVVPMTKMSESDAFMKGVSDRRVLGEILVAGEYLAPRKLADGSTGTFQIERRRFKASERDLLDDYYKRVLGVVFYKPHPWTRAYRIEGHLERFENREWLMSLLAAIRAHTETSRRIVEPFPQFMADYTAKRLSAVAKLYGQLNWHRHPEANYLPTRTGR
jgi:hypothetical protein